MSEKPMRWRALEVSFLWPIPNLWRSMAQILSNLSACNEQLRATSHMRLRARDQYTSSTLIGGKGGAGSSSLHTMLEGPMECMNARWM